MAFATSHNSQQPWLSILPCKIPPFSFLPLVLSKPRPTHATKQTQLALTHYLCDPTACCLPRNNSFPTIYITSPPLCWWQHCNNCIQQTITASIEETYISLGKSELGPSSRTQYLSTNKRKWLSSTPCTSFDISSMLHTWMSKHLPNSLPMSNRPFNPSGDSNGRCSSFGILITSPRNQDKLPTEHDCYNLYSQTSMHWLHNASICTTTTYPSPTSDFVFSSKSRRTRRHCITTASMPWPTQQRPLTSYVTGISSQKTTFGPCLHQCHPIQHHRSKKMSDLLPHP